MKKIIVLNGLLAFLFFSCEKNVTIDIPRKDPKLVVNGFIEKGEEIRLRVGQTRYILEQDAPFPLAGKYVVTDAVPVIYEDNIAVETMVYKPSTYDYESPHHITVKAGHTYSVKVTAPAFKEVEAMTVVPSQSTIAELRWNRHVRVDDYGQPMDDIILKIDDPVAEKNFYLIKLFTGGYNSPGFTLGCVSTTDKDLETTGEETDPLETETCYDGGNLLMKDENFNGRQKTLKLSVLSDMIRVNRDYQTGQVFRSYVKVYRITEDYFKFGKSWGIYNAVNENPFAEPVNIFSNVKNGYGIFSACTMAVDSLR